MVDRLVPFLRGGKTRDDLTGLRGAFAESLANLIENAPPDVRRTLGIVSAYRRPERQSELFSEAVAKYGSEAAARKWVAPPGRSRHNHGDAVDLGFGPKGTPEYQAAVKYAHENAQKYGLSFPLGHEPWHVEPIGARGGKAMTLPAAAGGPAVGPAAPGGSAVPSMVGATDTMPAPAAPVAEEPTLASAFTSALSQFAANQQQQAPQAAQMTAQPFQQPQMAMKKPDLAKILAGTSSPLLIGKPVA